MQLFGTEFGRNLIHPDIWQIRAEAALDSTKNLVLTDCRFNNEAEWARNRGGYVIRISRNNIPRVHTHVSEQGISETLIDYEVENNGTLEELFAALDAAYTKRHWEC
jgi:hypothetical protein